jgi:glutamate/tyrosine decarboxylase-like PLP-dependent enzyme
VTPASWSLGETAAAVRFAADAAQEYLSELDRRPARHPRADEVALGFGGPLPEEGDGALAPLRELAREGAEAAVHSAGPRFFHFVTGGTTPAALGADWLATTFDQSAFTWVGSPLGSQLEAVAVDWLKQLFELPAEWAGILTTGATMANFTGLAAARQWWGEHHGADVAERGLAGLPPVPVLSSGYAHSTALKALSMLGIGRASLRTFGRDEAGRADLEAIEDALVGLDGAPAIVIGNAGDVNTGDFDPLEALADLCARHGAWLHVDGAFGLFARISPRSAALAAGVERADSVIADGHKWLNVPYDCGFAFVRDRALLGRVFTLDAAYLPRPDDPRPTFGFLGPESSRRARGLAVWATLRAYGRGGYRELVERCLDLAQRIARRVDAAPDLERLAEVPLNIVAFRYRPEGRPEAELDDLNRRLGAAVLEDGRVYVGTTVYRGHVCFRPAVVNWRTGPDDVDLLVDVIRELGAGLA